MAKQPTPAKADKTEPKTDNEPTIDADAKVDPKADEKKTAAPKAKTKEPTSAADVAKLLDGQVRVPVTKKGKTELVERDIGADDILSFKVYGDRVVAVTIDGQKLEAEIG